MRYVGVALLALMLLAVPAQAQDEPPFTAVSYRIALSRVTMKLDFHGDKPSGCARRGLCETSGTVTTTLHPLALGVGSIAAADGNVLGVLFGFVRGITRAVVHTTGGPDCRDDASPSSVLFSMFAAPGRPARVFVGSGPVEQPASNSGVSFGGPAGEDLFATRCAGPTIEDLSAALPRAFVKRSWLLRRHFSVRLSRVRVFKAGGFTGTITGNMRLRFSRQRCIGTRSRHCPDFDAAVTNSG